MEVLWVWFQIPVKLEKEMATHSSILVWRIPWAEEPGGLQSTGSQESDVTEHTAHTNKVRQDRAHSTHPSTQQHQQTKHHKSRTSSGVSNPDVCIKVVYFVLQSIKCAKALYKKMYTAKLKVVYF